MQKIDLENGSANKQTIIGGMTVPNKPTYLSAKNSDKINYCGIGINLKLNTEKSNADKIYEGNINNKHAVFRVADSDPDIPVYYAGNIDNTKISFAISDNRTGGLYNGKRFSTEITYNKPSKISYFINHTILGKTYKPDYINIKGNIADKRFNITLPQNIETYDEDVKNIIAITLYCQGF